VKSRTVSIPLEATPVEEGVKNELDRIIAAAKGKEHIDYPANTSLIIFFDDSSPREAMSDDKLDSFVKKDILNLDLRFSALYLVGKADKIFREYQINRQD
jgi:hypothetical protein